MLVGDAGADRGAREEDPLERDTRRVPLDQRDTAILQPLPVRPATLRLAKLTAVAMLGAGAAIAVNVFPSLLFPWMLAFAVPQMSAVDVFWMIGINVMLNVTAAVFGYLVVIALRESSSVLLGATLFARASPWMQTTTIVLLGSAMLPHVVIVTVVAYLLSGHRGIYPAQRLLRKKHGPALAEEVPLRDYKEEP